MKGRKKTIPLSEQLNAVPVRNLHIRSMPCDDPDACIIEIELRYRGWKRFLQRRFGAHTTRQYKLEGIGREVYENIDGELTLEQHIDAFAERNRLTFFESRSLLLQYLRTLMRRGLIVMAVPKTDA